MIEEGEWIQFDFLEKKSILMNDYRWGSIFKLEEMIEAEGTSFS